MLGFVQVLEFTSRHPLQLELVEHVDGRLVDVANCDFTGTQCWERLHQPQGDVHFLDNPAVVHSEHEVNFEQVILELDAH